MDEVGKKAGCTQGSSLCVVQISERARESEGEGRERDGVYSIK